MSNKLKLLAEGIGGGALVAAALILWPALVPHWLRKWGATPGELNQALPGDELIPQPKTGYTQAITIQASASSIWPWLAQMGQGRGGFYSYEWLENMAGCDIHNAEQIMPQFQSLQVGDGVRLHPQMPPIPVAAVEPNRAIVLYGPANEAAGYMATTWVFVLEERADKTTRLISRWKVDYRPGLGNEIGLHFFLEPISEIMQRKMLLGIKRLVEFAQQER